jgi:hypothetical protein
LRTKKNKFEHIVVLNTLQEVCNMFQAIPVITGEMFTVEQAVLTHKHLPYGGWY